MGKRFLIHRNGDEGDPAAPSPGENGKRFHPSTVHTAAADYDINRYDPHTANDRSGGQQVVDTVADSQNATKR